MKKTILLFLLLTPFLIFAQFGEQQIIDDTNALSTWSVFVADVDGDNYLDVLATSEAENKIVWYKNLDGLGTFGTQNIITSNLEYTRYVTATDIDGDGDMDILATALFIDLVVWYENTDGLGNFGSQQLISNNLLLPKMAITGDVDSDGDLDIIIASRADNKVTWVENNNNTFSTQHTITNIAQSVASVFYADINGDGIKDVICDSSNNGVGNPSWFENDGLGNFGALQEITQDTYGSIYTIANDIDSDGDMDIVNLEFGSNTISWFENTDGLGSFGPKQIITTEVSSPILFVLADLDNDGDKDIVYNSQGLFVEKVAWQANDGHGNFGPQQLIYNPSTSAVIALRGLFAADIDDDGDMDVFSSSIGDDKIAWFENLTILGIEENLQQKISLHPNPANNLINITNTSGYAINQITIYNLLSNQIKQVKGNISQINITELPTGVYFVNLETEKGSVTKKVIKE